MTTQNKFPNVSLVDVLRKTKAAVKKEINCIKVGKINSFDADKQQAEVEIIISKILNIDSEGVKTIRKYPLLVEVPSVVIGGGESYLQMPINKGDTCLVLFNDDDIDGWVTNNETTPYTNRKHDLTDAFCLVGVNNETQTRMAFDGDGIKLFFSDSSYIKLNADGIGMMGNVVVENDLEIKGDVEIAGDVEMNGDVTFNGAVKPDGVEGVDETITIIDTTAAGPVSTTIITVKKGIITNVVG